MTHDQTHAPGSTVWSLVSKWRERSPIEWWDIWIQAEVRLFAFMSEPYARCLAALAIN